MSYLRDHEPWRVANLAALRSSGLPFRETETACIFREPGKPKVDFYQHTGRWRVVGVGPDHGMKRGGERGADGRTFRGGAQSFLSWYAKQVPVTPGGKEGT